VRISTHGMKGHRLTLAGGAPALIGATTSGDGGTDTNGLLVLPHAAISTICQRLLTFPTGHPLFAEET